MANPQLILKRATRPRETSRTTSRRTARTVTHEAARVGEQTHAPAPTSPAAEPRRHGTACSRALNLATESFQRINDQFTKALGFNGPQAEELARRSSQNLQAVSQASSVLMKGAQEVSHEWFGFAQDRVQKNIDGLNRLLAAARCRTL